jgi:diguanylate cyclase (GGDEF)-like protein/PAS domain S-box-containing protein
VPAEVQALMTDAEDTLRAIAAGEVDAFIVADGEAGQSVFTLSTADRPYRMFVENMRDGAATLSASGLILYANRRLAQLLSCPRAEIIGSPLATFVAGGFPNALNQFRGPDSLAGTVEFDLVGRDGNAVSVLVGVSPLEVDGDHLTCLTFTDLSAQKDQEREIARLSQGQAARLADLQAAQVALTEQATHDALTGLPNRALLIDRLDQALSIARRSGWCVAVFFVDLDRFKLINDTHGHAEGDAVLRSVADKLVGALRPMDTVARIGGDEFVVLAPDVGSHLHAVDLSARLLDGVAASIGISVSVAGRGTAETLLNEADAAMYQAKVLGGGRAEVFDSALGRQVQQRSTARRVLESALDEQRVVVYYQPVIDLSSGRVAGFEALARIAEHDGSLLSPAAFVPVAEDTGLVVPLGTAVLGMACAEARGWQPAASSESPLPVAVNLSSRQFESGDLPAIVRAALEETGLDPSCLHLELTETSVIALGPDLLDQLGSIRDLGVQVGLDDFGTGYASLTHLRRLPLTFVKIDQSFVQGLGTDAEDEGIVAAVVALATHLGLRSIAEGVETEDQLARVREIGCDQAQGYLFARPAPPEVALKAIRDVTSSARLVSVPAGSGSKRSA